MKLRLFAFLFFTCAMLAGKAMAQGCNTAPIQFPPPVGPDLTMLPGTCTANPEPDSSTGQGGRLRWDDNNNHELVLFDSDSGGNFLWCSGGGDNSNNCAVGAVLCLQHDGNMVMYLSVGAIQPQCVNDGDGGLAVWASNTDRCNDDGQEVLEIEDNVVFNGVLRTGDRVVIRNGAGIQFISLGYTDVN